MLEQNKKEKNEHKKCGGKKITQGKLDAQWPFDGHCMANYKFV